MRISYWSSDVCSSDLTMILRNAILPALLAAVIAFPAAAAEPPEKIKAAGKVVIATMPNYPPITYKDPATNTLKGFDIEQIGEHTSELQSLMRTSYAVFCLKKKTNKK